jgi:ribosome biogenesis GTPase / thiamine phosphate phosphatase
MTDTETPTELWFHVIRVDYGGCLVSTEDGPTFARTRGEVAVGDWVQLSPDAEPAVENVAERRTQLTRRDPEGKIQVLAANVDVVLVAAPADRLSLARAEREIAIAWDSGAQPVVLLMKADLDDGTHVSELRERLLGVDVLAVSAVDSKSLDAVRALLAPDRTAVLLGPSGAGKSTLVNALLGSQAAATGEVRSGDHRGRHTTTARELHAVPSGGYLIDTPGLRSVSLAVDEVSVLATYPDIAELAGHCKFRDCTHSHEPGCAVSAAVSSGELSPDRLASFHRLMKDLDYVRRRDDPVAAQEHRALWRQRSMDARRLDQARSP